MDANSALGRSRRPGARWPASAEDHNEERLAVTNRGRPLKSQHVDALYAGEIVRILEAACASVVWNWAKAGMVANRVTGEGARFAEIRTYSLLIWDGRGFEGWMPAEAIHDLNGALRGWLEALERDRRPAWTALFVGVVNGIDRSRSRWIPSHDAAYGPWAIRLGESNVPMVESGLAGM